MSLLASAGCLGELPHPAGMRDHDYEGGLYPEQEKALGGNFSTACQVKLLRARLGRHVRDRLQTLTVLGVAPTGTAAPTW